MYYILPRQRRPCDELWTSCDSMDTLDQTSVAICEATAMRAQSRRRAGTGPSLDTSYVRCHNAGIVVCGGLQKNDCWAVSVWKCLRDPMVCLLCEFGRAIDASCWLNAAGRVPKWGVGNLGLAFQTRIANLELVVFEDIFENLAGTASSYSTVMLRCRLRLIERGAGSSDA